MGRQDDFYKKIARQYLETYGQELEQERLTLERPESGAPQSVRTGLADKVYGRINREEALRKRGLWRYALPAAGLAAACVLAAVLLPLGQRGSPPSAPPAPSAPAAPAAPGPDGQTPLPWPVVQTPSAGQESLIPLDIVLASGFSVSKVEQDRGQTIYYLEDEGRDDVVLALERRAVPGRDGLKETELQGTKVYGLSGADYSLLELERDGICYAMSCRHDINTLVRLARSIL